MTDTLKRKIEDRTIAVLRDIINMHPTMDYKIDRGDKNMSWDGYIRVFSEGGYAIRQEEFPCRCADTN